MSTIQLYQGLIDATKQILDQYGKDVLREERFVNILADLYRDRDNPAIFRIIKSAIQDDVLKCVLNANANDIESHVAVVSNSLTKKYGFDQSLVKGLLYSLAVGYGSISTTQFFSFSSPRNIPSKKQVTLPPTKKYYSRPIKPINNSKKTNINVDKVPLKQLFFLVLSLFGLFTSTIIYAFSLCYVAKSIPTSATINVAIWQLFTVFPISISLFDYFQDKNKSINTKLLGAYVTLHFIAIAFWLFFPFFFGISDVQFFFGFPINEDGFPIGATFLNLFCAYFMYARIIEIFNNIPATNFNGNTTLFDKLAYCFKLDYFRNGFYAVLITFICLGLVLVVYPILPNSSWHPVEKIDLKYESINKQKEALKNERSKSERKLSFAQYNIGDSFSTCIDKIPSTEEYNVHYDDFLTIGDISYDSMIDSVITVKTQWNNEDINIYLYFNKSKLFAISFEPENISGDSLINMYTSKYGEPEYHLTTYYEKCGGIVDKKTFYKNHSDVHINYNDHPKDYFWTYKNGFINIHSRLSGYRGKVTYFDRKTELNQKSKMLEQEKIRKAAEKRLADSLQRIMDEQERLEEEQRRIEINKRKMNYKKSIDQI